MDSASSCSFIIRLYGISEGSSNKSPGIVMEYMENGSLDTLMDRVGTMPWALKFRILYEVALGMNYLHTLSPPLLHLDLKTKNILIDEDLHIKITDFGLSKYTSSSSSCKLDQGEGVAGTLEYMPPEAFQEGYQPHKSTDVYSFAILSAVVLKGEDPYPVNKSVLIRLLVMEGQRPCLKSLQNENYVKSLHEAVQLTMKCWHNDKLKRPSFSDCCSQWERFNSEYDKREIKKAVRDVQDKLDSYDKTTEDSHTKGTISASVTTTEMVAMTERLQTMQMSEHPSVLQQAVPVNSSPKTRRQYTGVPGQPLPQAKQPMASRPTYQPMSTRPHNPGAAFPFNWSSHATGYQYLPRVPAFYPPSYPQSPFPPTTVNIHDCAGPIQIGDNNTMTVRTYQSVPVNIRLTRPGQVIHRNYSPPLSTGPIPTAQPQPTMPSREASSGHTLCKQETEPKRDQPIQIPLLHTTSISGSPQGQVNNLPNTQASRPDFKVLPKKP
ncbi:receptor-interacting serine/threonine-protein kinase 3-like isoform X2 [Pseudophryne corroboree]